jgi:hypothetical protein
MPTMKARNRTDPTSKKQVVDDGHLRGVETVNIIVLAQRDVTSIGNTRREPPHRCESREA